MMDYSPADARELIDYYIEHWDSPNLDWFLFNYERVEQAKTDHDEQEAVAAKRRAATEKRLEEWRNRWKNQES